MHPSLSRPRPRAERPCTGHGLTLTIMDQPFQPAALSQSAQRSGLQFGNIGHRPSRGLNHDARIGDGIRRLSQEGRWRVWTTLAFNNVRHSPSLIMLPFPLRSPAITERIGFYTRSRVTRHSRRYWKKSENRCQSIFLLVKKGARSSYCS